MPSNAPTICTTLSGIPSPPLPQPHDLIKCFVTERVLKRHPGVTRGPAGPTITLSGRVLLNHYHRLHFQTRHLRIQINEVPLNSNSHRGPEEVIKRPCDLLPKAAFSQLGSEVGSGRLLARTRGRVAWSCRVARRVPHSFPVPERHCASGPAPPFAPEAVRALRPAVPVTRVDSHLSAPRSSVPPRGGSRPRPDPYGFPSARGPLSSGRGLPEREALT